MSDNNIKTNAKSAAETADVSGEALKKSVAEALAKASGEKTPMNNAPMNNVGAERILELCQEVSASGLPDKEKENLTANLLSEWARILEDISEKAFEQAASESAQPRLSVGYILSQLEKIQQDNEHVLKALETLSGIDSGKVPGDVAGEGKANGIADTVKCRETTNQKLIAFYEKLYDDVKQDSGEINRVSLIDLITAIERCDAGAMNGETSAAVKSALFDRLKSDVAPKSTKEMALEIVSQAVSRNYGDSDPEQLANLAEAISSVLDGVRHIDH